jgi:LysR family glycine cleavage system transcriptional activator
VRASAGFAICGLALLAGRIDDTTLSLPFPLSRGNWTEHAFRARFRAAALSRPQVKAFREWLISQAAGTRTWLARVAESRGGPQES